MSLEGAEPGHPDPGRVDGGAAGRLKAGQRSPDAAISGAGTTTGAQVISWAEAALRWLLFVGLAVALGGLIGERFTTSAHAEKPALRPVRSWVPPGAMLGLAGVAGLATMLVLNTDAVSTL